MTIQKTSTKRTVKPSFIYIIEAVEIHSYKVGVSCNPIARYRNMQTSSGADLVLLGYWHGSRTTERKIHKSLLRFRKRGEWFKVDIAVIAAAIARFCNKTKGEILQDIESRLLRVEPKGRRLVAVKAAKKPKGQMVKSKPVETMPSIPNIQWEKDDGGSVAAFYLFKPNIPRKQWIHLGYLEKSALFSYASITKWITRRYFELCLHKYNPDLLLNAWISMEKGIEQKTG